VRVHLADWPEVGNGQTGAVLGKQQGAKGKGQALESYRVRQKECAESAGIVAAQFP